MTWRTDLRECNPLPPLARCRPLRHTLGSVGLMNAFSERDGTMVSRLAFCLVLPCVLGVFGGVTAVSAQDPVPVVIDSDMIADDWMAALVVLNDPAFAVKAITVAGTGFADCAAGLRSALGLLALTD